MLCLNSLGLFSFVFILIMLLQGPISSVGRTYRVVSCTKKAVFAASLLDLKSVDILVTSVLANFISSACDGDDVTAASHREITEHVETLHRYSLSNPDTRIVVAPPLPRNNPDWFPAYLPGFSSFLYHEVTRMSNPNLKFMTPFVAPPAFFETDGVHLNADAGLAFVHFLVSNSDLLFPPSSTAIATVQGDASVSASITSLSRSVDELRSDVHRRRLQDNLLFARIKEDRDFEINKAREDRCTISGLSISTPPPSDPQEKKAFFISVVTKLVEEACPEAEGRPTVVDVLVNMRFGRGPPYFEVKLDSVASSLKFRVAASKLAKDGAGSFSGLFISNTVNLSTRVRIDILKLIAKRLTTPTEVGYVQGFSSRPTLHYRMKDVPYEEGRAPVIPVNTPGTGRSYNFVESVERWGQLLSAGSLESVRRKASMSFSGCLEQYFVVLRDQAHQDPGDSFISRLTGSSGRGSYSGRFPRGQRYSGRRGGSSSSRGRGHTPSGANSWAKYDDGGPRPLASSSAASEQTGLKRSLPDDADLGGTPKKRTEMD